ncbi:MAG: zinc ribbon domain-containing protein [Chloroflexi bacterium]|nr:zinc ribbon domain-containing protein [Chloroflexota bacterium]
MPIYEFRCLGCGYRFSQLSRRVQGSDEGKAPACPQCGALDTRRVLSTFAIHGPSTPDAREAAAERAQAERAVSITPREQINKWRGGLG